MEIIATIFVVVVLAVLALWANERINTVPILKTVIQVLIVVVSVFVVLEKTGLMKHVK